MLKTIVFAIRSVDRWVSLRVISNEVFFAYRTDIAIGTVLDLPALPNLQELASICRDTENVPTAAVDSKFAT